MDHMWCGSECAVAKTPVPDPQRLVLAAQLAWTSLHAPCVHLALSGNACSWADKYLSVSPRGLILQVSTITVQFCCVQLLSREFSGNRKCSGPAASGPQVLAFLFTPLFLMSCGLTVFYSQ